MRLILTAPLNEDSLSRNGLDASTSTMSSMGWKGESFGEQISRIINRSDTASGTDPAPKSCNVVVTGELPRLRCIVCLHRCGLGVGHSVVGVDEIRVLGWVSSGASVGGTCRFVVSLVLKSPSSTAGTWTFAKNWNRACSGSRTVSGAPICPW